MASFDASSSTALAGFIAQAASGDTINLTKSTPYASITTLAKRPSRSGVVSGFGYTINGNNKIINDTRIYQENVDGALGAPGTLSNVTLNYTSTTGVAAAGGALLSVSNFSATQRVFDLQSVAFTGQHSGWNLNGNKYISFTAFGSSTVNVKFDLTSSSVAITGQNNGFQSTLGVGSGGSAFFHNWNNLGAVTISNTTFDEKGFLSSFNLFNTSTIHGAAVITGNTFQRTGNANVRWEGNRLQNVNATLSSNTFSNGSYLDLYGNVGSITINGGNTFNTIANGYGIRMTDALTGTPTIAGSNIFTGGGLALKFVKATAGSTSLTTLGTFTVNGSSFINLFAGGQASDTITGNATANWISGDTGNDILTGGIGDDAFVFATALDASTNLDTITDFTNSGQADKIWLANSVFTGLSAGSLSVGDFGATAASGVDVVYSGGDLYFAAGGSVSLAGYTKFATLTGAPALTIGDFLIF
jgi:Ca2+-binding RTX toxin-like protein